MTRPILFVLFALAGLLWASWTASQTLAAEPPAFEQAAEKLQASTVTVRIVSKSSSGVSSPAAMHEGSHFQRISTPENR